MTGPLVPPLGAAPVGNQPLGAGELGPGQNRAGGQPVSATVIAITRQGPLIEAGGQRFLLQGAPPLPAGATLNLDLAGAGRRTMPGRLLAVAGRLLEPPVDIRLQPAPPTAGAHQAAGRAPQPTVGSPARVPAGVQLEARLLGPDGRPAGPPIAIRLTAASPAPGDDPGGRRGAAGGPPAPNSPAQSSRRPRRGPGTAAPRPPARAGSAWCGPPAPAAGRPGRGRRRIRESDARRSGSRQSPAGPRARIAGSPARRAVRASARGSGSGRRPRRSKGASQGSAPPGLARARAPEHSRPGSA